MEMEMEMEMEMQWTVAIGSVLDSWTACKGSQRLQSESLIYTTPRVFSADGGITISRKS